MFFLFSFFLSFPAVALTLKSGTLFISSPPTCTRVKEKRTKLMAGHSSGCAVVQDCFPSFKKSFSFEQQKKGRRKEAALVCVRVTERLGVSLGVCDKIITQLWKQTKVSKPPPTCCRWRCVLFSLRPAGHWSRASRMCGGLRPLFVCEVMALLA